MGEKKSLATPTRLTYNRRHQSNNFHTRNLTTMTKDELEAENAKLQADNEKLEADHAALQDQHAALQKEHATKVGAGTIGGGASVKPTDLDEYKGSYKNKAGETFGLKKLKPEDALNGKTHQLKNELHFWEGDEDAFKAEFEKD